MRHANKVATKTASRTPHATFGSNLQYIGTSICKYMHTYTSRYEHKCDFAIMPVWPYKELLGVDKKPLV